MIKEYHDLYTNTADLDKPFNEKMNENFYSCNYVWNRSQFGQVLEVQTVVPNWKYISCAHVSK